MPSGGQGAKMERTNGKPTRQQRDHILEHHLQIAIVNERVHLSYVQECGEKNTGKDCPVPNEASVFLCKRPPCPG